MKALVLGILVVVGACVGDPGVGSIAHGGGFCGNGVVESPEECDDGNFNTDDDCIIDEGGSSSTNCKFARCGDGHRHTSGTGPFEECDDGNTDNNDDCPVCHFAFCGDGYTDSEGKAFEECDDGNDVNTDACVEIDFGKGSEGCIAASCGDGYVHAGVETCDDENMDSGDGCSNVCLIEGECGDGVVNAGEGCDGGGQTAHCDADCTPAVCGDGVVNAAANEHCDDGAANGNTPNHCRLDCSEPRCGDGIVDAREECDDANLNGIDDFSGCTTDCSAITAVARSGACDAGSSGGPAWLLLVGLAWFAARRRRPRKAAAAGAAVPLVLLVLVACVLWPTTSSADGFRLSRFEPAPSLEDGLTVSLPATLEASRFSANLTLDFADRPFVLKTMQGGVETDHDIIDNSIGTHADLALGVGERFEIFASLPVTLDQFANQGSVNMMSFDAGRTSVGDFRLGGSLRLAGDRKELGPALGVSGTLVLPSGSPADFAGDDGVGFDLLAMGSYALAKVTLAADVGVALRPSADFADVRLGSEVVSRVGALFPVGDNVTLMGELAAGIPLREQVGSPPLPAELLGGGRYRFDNWVFGVGTGVGLTDALGIPVWRAIFSFGYIDDREKKEPAPRVRVVVEDPDPDKDGFMKPRDECPNEPEDRDGFEDGNGCPEIDNDKDMIVDSDDKCPNDAEDKDDFEDADGCPDLDNDADKIVDANDKCPNEPETINKFEDTDGCPDIVPRPTLDAALKLLADRVQFEQNKAELMPDSERVIGEIAALLKQVPEVEVLSIEGHASKEGSKKHNDQLSADRAQAAVDALVKAGVSPDRLRVSHFGSQKPVGTDSDEAQRKLSRRVEFHIVRYAGQDIGPPTAPPTPAPAPAPAKPAPAPAPAKPAPAPAPTTPAPAPAPAPKPTP